MKKNRQKVHVKIGNYVQIISGKYKGKTGKIIKIINKTQQVIVENFNIKTKHIQPKQQGDTGKIVKIEAPIHSSNVMLYSIKNKIASRYKYKINKNNTKQKILIKTNETII
uniref:Large ribosomal subunit protein uL24c n=1 Tax=Dicranema revolutum TaxID=239144 RepID=A0A4D6WV43_9FLOR|nr:ribosomal protein L24 [Dicranema revolutum]